MDYDDAYRDLIRLMGNNWMALWMDYLEAGAPFGFKERHVALWITFETRTTTN